LRKFFIPGLLVVSCIVSGLGWFLGSTPSNLSLFFWIAGYVLVSFSIAYRSLFSELPFNGLPFIILGVVLLNFFVQITGGVHSSLWPAYFVFASIVAVFAPLPQTFATTGTILAIEGANLLFSKQWDADQLPIYLGFAVSLVAVPGVISHIIRRTRREAEQVKDKHDRLIEHADAIDPLADNDTVEALTEENRLASTIKAVRDLEGAFSGLIDMIYEFVPGHAYAVFHKERFGESDAFVLRARRSDSDDRFLAPLGELLEPGKDNGIISGCIRHLQPQYFSDIGHLVGTMGYYTRSLPIKSLLAVPIVHEGGCIGVLAVDSLEKGAFSLETQDMIVRFAPFFIQIIEKIRVSQELGVRATTFAAMHKISTVLNSTLELNEILERLAREINVLVPYDFCLFLQYDEKSRTIAVAHHSGSVELVPSDRSLITKIASVVTSMAENSSFVQNHIAAFPLEQGTLVNQMLNQWEQRQAAPYHFFDLGDRTIRGLFDTATGLNRQLRSLSCWPLATGEKFIGAFFLGSLQAHAFPEFHRHFLDTLSNQIALIMDNAILHRQISSLARTDGLTGLLNHRTFMEKLSEEYKRIDRERRPFSILLMDIDKFKNVNDTYGHPVGDLAIKAVANVLRESARATDFAARYGGEEFAVGMVDTSIKGAEQMAERVRAIMEKTVVTRIGSRDLVVTLSIGVSSFPEDTENTADLVTMADNALYQAKRSGRNRVCLHKDIRAGEGESIA
jgi:diguanylate cyclase (GGDEF)-like protein